MTRILLVRHGEHDLLNRALAGRMPSVHLNASGIACTETLAQELAKLPIDAVFSSPLERSMESAAPLCKLLGQDCRVSEAITEVDFGEWTGWTFHSLNDSSEWQRYNEFRGNSSVPGGERPQEIQDRMLDFIDSVCKEFPEGLVAAYSHGDAIKLALMNALGMPIDFIHRLEVSPASVSALELGGIVPRVMFVNRTSPLTLDL